MNNGFKIPTDTEIEMAYTTMLPDMRNQETAARMGQLTATNPMLQYQIGKLLEGAFAAVKAGAMDAGVAMEAVIGSALGYGLHLGIYIGQARGGNESVQ
jgi:hypothetical protein